MKIRNFVFLQVAIFIYSLSNVFAKFAAYEEFLSFRYILFMGLLLLCLGVYALMCQQILKKIPLSVAYAFNGLSILWGILLGLLIFQEQITLKACIGALFIIAGIIVISSGEKEHE